MDAEQHESWVRGVLAKHPVESLRLLAALCEAGLRSGTCSANDLGDQSYSQPQAVGAVFKLAKRVGFVRTDSIVPSTRSRSHASFILVWRLEERWKAERFLAACRRLLVQTESGTVTQGMLPI